MIIENLTVTDFRVFSGRHSIDLKPRTKYKKERSIILFGGLNGAGKTTTLTAIRLALYGKQSLGHGTSIKAYHEFLAKSIHKSKNTPRQSNTSEIELTFSYANMGLIHHYRIYRSWMITNGKIFESLKLYEDDHELSELNSEQCQGFLNEIIPIGVSDLFFFDGEKIKELALDSDGMALGASIKKLLGLDIIETLQSDLSLYLRNRMKQGSPDVIENEITNLEEQLKAQETIAEKRLLEYEQIIPGLADINAEISNLEQQLSSRGGAWASTREDEKQKYDSLAVEKKQLQKTLKDVLANNYPIYLAQGFIETALKQLHEESEAKHLSSSSSLINKHIKRLDHSLKKLISDEDYSAVIKAISDEFYPLLSPNDNTDIVHDISDRSLGEIEKTIKDATTTQKNTVVSISERINRINTELDQAGLNLARAPNESAIMPLFEDIQSAQNKRALLHARQQQCLENHSKALSECIEIARKLDRLSQANHDISDEGLSIEYAKGAKQLLDEFVVEMSERKVMDLENEFIASFHRLSRKEDTHYTASIDPNTYLVKLIGENGLEVDKNDLSAGEKQIYAIAILEALARTSGRNLPIIIDTPLGRLDSKHRSKLIHNYFPHASQQVIILSTDTEVDENFYAELSSNISHAFKLEYSSATGAADIHEGYFWRNTHSEATH